MVCWGTHLPEERPHPCVLRPGSPQSIPPPPEQTIRRLIKRAKLFVFLRQHRHELFDEAFQTELAGIYNDLPFGHPPVPPAQLALATILQACTGVGDDEVIEVLVMDRRWQLVLDCLDALWPNLSSGYIYCCQFTAGSGSPAGYGEAIDGGAH